MEAALDLVTHRRPAQGFDVVIVHGFQALAEDVGEGVGFPENHACAPAEFDGIDFGVVDFDAVDPEATAGNARTENEVVHTVESAQECGLAATGGSDESVDPAAGCLNVEFSGLNVSIFRSFIGA